MPESPQLGSNRPVGGSIRADIQALRAIAILSVVAFHFWPTFARGGFVGVDIFFVISGYLITGQLWREVLLEGRVRFAKFWARRARRLLPVSLLVILFTGIASLLVMPMTRSMLIFDEAGASATYWQNWLMIFKATDYLQQNISSLSPFQHFWSLSVEEQYYIAWPFFVWVVLWLSLRLRMTIRARSVLASALLAAILIASLSVSVELTAANPPLAYFSTATRAWEFAGGALIAIVVDQSLLRFRNAENRSPMWFWLGFALMLGSIFLFNDSTPFPSFWAALPCLGASLAIFGGQSQKPLMPRRALSWAPVQFLGDISYSLYLWHWPLFVLVPIWLGHSIDDLTKWTVLLVSIGLAWASKRFVEDPIRFGWLSRRHNLTQLAIILASMVLVTFASTRLSVHATETLNAGYAAKTFVPSLANLPKDESPIDSYSCAVSKSEDAFRTCDYGDPKGTVRVAMLGDSHVRQYYTPISAIAKAHHWRITLISKSACPALAYAFLSSQPFDKSCTNWEARLKSYLETNPRFDLIITSASSLVTSNIRSIGPNFASLVASQTARGSKWLVIRDNTKPRPDFVACIEEHQSSVDSSCSVSKTFGLRPIDRLPKTVAGFDGVTIADFTDIYCPSSCSPVIGNIIVYRDHSHLSNTFAATLKPAFEAVLSKEFLK